MNLTFRTDAFEDAAVVRRAVFMEEQGFQNEFDEVDKDARTIHLTAYDEDGQLMACARVFPSELEPGTETVPGKWVFGRLATKIDMRNKGIGSAVLTEAERRVREAGGQEIHLHAQCSAQPFYVRAGYAAYGPIEFDEHVEHQWMEKDIRE